jgi:hypothetical protein
MILFLLIFLSCFFFRKNLIIKFPFGFVEGKWKMRQKFYIILFNRFNLKYQTLLDLEKAMADANYFEFIFGLKVQLCCYLMN